MRMNDNPVTRRDMAKGIHPAVSPENHWPGQRAILTCKTEGKELAAKEKIVSVK